MTSETDTTMRAVRIHAPGGAEAMRAAILRDLPRWAAVVRASGAKLD